MMRLSTEIIADKLAAFAPEIYITSGDMMISGVRLLETAGRIRRDILYIASAREYFDDALFENCVLCVHGPDFITLRHTDQNEALAAILDIFEEFSNWESALQDAAHAGRDMQHFIEISRYALPYPMFITDALGNIVGYSREYGENEVDIFWDSIVLFGKTHDGMFSGSLADSANNEVNDWNVIPTVYNTPQNRIIGLHLKQDAETIGSIVIIEQKQRLSAGACQLSGVFRDAASYAIHRSGNTAQLRTIAAIVQDYLDGKSVDEDILWEHIRNCAGNTEEELVLILLRNIDRADFNYKSNMSHRLAHGGIQCLCMPYHECILAVIARANESAFIKKVQESLPGDDYLCGVSMPFSTVQTIKNALSQAMLALKIGDKTPCAINKCVDYAYSYLLSQMAQDDSTTPGLLHPALAALKKYDEKHHTSLYETLYEYLRLERNVVATAKRLFIHRNSMIYRLQRLEKLLGLDLDDVNVRMYLLLSYHIDMLRS